MDKGTAKVDEDKDNESTAISAEKMFPGKEAPELT